MILAPGVCGRGFGPAVASSFLLDPVEPADPLDPADPLVPHETSGSFILAVKSNDCCMFSGKWCPHSIKESKRVRNGTLRAENRSEWIASLRIQYEPQNSMSNNSISMISDSMLESNIFGKQWLGGNSMDCLDFF